ncbi:MAG: hypothetical protein JO352_08885 [Chloroflexi bacterium]|nr:hypothetical protein [Chloroflexota bacterium]MBV9595727.1 hypothetical protein [Chloroflexota bacterium]
MTADGPASPTFLAEKALRRQIDRSISRALADGDFARQLLTNPALVVEDRGCSPQQLRSLRTIRAADVTEFARQAHALFWLGEPKRSALTADSRLAMAAHR